MAAYGGHFDRTQTWWEHGAREFFTYVARAQHLLQQGKFVGDVLLCTSGEAPDYGTDGEIPRGYDGDRCHPIAIAKCRVDGGCVVVPGGVRYRVVGTPPRASLRSEVNAVLDRIERAGANVVEYGYVATALKRMGCRPDFECDDNDVTWMHRRIDDDDLYFVAVPNEIEKKVRCSFRVHGKMPELWDPVSGSVQVVDAADFRTTADGCTELTLDCPPVHSVFVMFRPRQKGSVPTAKGSVPNVEGSVPKTIPVAGTWDVTFREPMATSDVATARFADLESWTKSDNPDIRYFSGTASYFMKFSLAGNGVCPQDDTSRRDMGCGLPRTYGKERCREGKVCGS